MLTIATTVVSLFCAAGPTMPSAAMSGKCVEAMRRAAKQEWARGRFDAAVSAYRRIIELDRRVAGQGELPVGDLHGMAVLSSEVGADGDARRYYQSELEILQRHGRLLEAGAVYTALAELSQFDGEFRRAEVEYKQALAVLQRSGPNSLALATVLENLGWLYVTWGRLNDGSRLLDEGQSVAQRCQCSQSASWIRHLDTQAAYRTILGQYTEAQRLWRQAITLEENLDGGVGFTYDNILMHFGQASLHIGDFKTAKEMFQRYLAIESRISRPYKTPRAIVTGELANLMAQQRDYDSARSLFEQALGMMRPEKAPLSLSLLLCYYGDYFMAREDWANAERRYREALALQEEVLGDTRVAASSMDSLSKALRKQHRKTEARELTEKADKIRSAQPDLLYSRNTVDVQAFRQHE
jgi:tetratricopeptide (TPR) repeat protein